jgi:hypothetical protein
MSSIIHICYVNPDFSKRHLVLKINSQFSCSASNFDINDTNSYFKNRRLLHHRLKAAHAELVTRVAVKQINFFSRNSGTVFQHFHFSFRRRKWSPFLANAQDSRPRRKAQHRARTRRSRMSVLMPKSKERWPGTQAPPKARSRV